MGTSAWTPVDETPSAASAWTPVAESKPAPVPRESTPEYQNWKQKRAAFEAMPLSKRMWMMATQPNSVPDPNGPANVPGSFEGHPENIGQYPVATVGRAAEGVVDMSRGNIAMGTHKLIQAGGNAIAPMAPILAAGAPLTALRALGGGVVGSKVAGAVANASGASDDQKALAEDAGNIVGGGVAATGAIRAFLGSPTRALLTKAAGATEGVISDDLLGTISPRALHGLRMLRAAAKVAGASEDSDLSAIATKHADAIGAKEQELNAALSKANALPPEGPTAKITDVPDLRVQPGQQAPQNLLEARKAAFMAAQRGAQGEFQVAPPEAPGPSAVIRNVQGQPVSGSQVAPQDIQPSVLRATGQPQSTGRGTPNMEIYNEPIQPPPPLKPPTLLEQLRQWDQIRQIHSQLEDQIGKGQDELQQWMEDHNQEAPGGKSTGAAATAKAKFQAARAAAESKANAVPDDAPTVAYRVRDAGETGIQPRGHAQATTDLEQAQSYVEGRGSAQNAPQEVVKVDLTKLKPSEYTLKTGPGGKTWVQFKSAVPESFIEKVGDTPRVPKDDADMEELLMKSVQAAKAKKAMSAKAGD